MNASIEKQKAGGFIFNRIPIPSIPYFTDYWHERAMKAYDNKILDGIRGRCEQKGYVYDPSRIHMILDQHKNELYYYQTDSGALEPIIALTPMGVKWSDAAVDQNITVTLESNELHSDIFKQITYDQSI